MRVPVLLAWLLLQGTLVPRLEMGAVSGRLLSVDGSPAAGVRVSALAVSGSTGAGALLSIAEADEQGRYRLENIPAGRYYITAGLVQIPNYYPGVATQALATVIDVLPGKTIENLDFSMVVPVGYTVSGRLPVKTHIPITSVTLRPTDSPGKMTAPKPDATFEFRNVPPGRYSLQVSGLRPSFITVADRDIVGINLGGGPGVSVYGRLSSPLTAPELLSRLTVSLSGGPIAVTTTSNNNAEFEFLEVPPGNYTLRTPTPLSQVTVPLVVADKNIDGLDVVIPFQLEMQGRIVEPGGKPFVDSSQGFIGISAVATNGTINSGMRPDGSFLMRLTEGSFQIGVLGLPIGYAVQSISAGTLDLLKQPLKIAAGQGITDIVVSIAAVTLDSVKGARFSGRIVGFPAGGVPGARITLDSGDSQTRGIQTTPNADGTFEFGKVPSGAYRLGVTGIPNADPLFFGPSERIEIGTTDVVGYQIPLNIRTTVTGKVTVVDRTGRARTDLLPAATIVMRRGNSGSSATITADGTFRVSINAGEYTVDFDRLSPQYTVQSITAGSVDLMKGSLLIQPNAGLPEIEIRLEFRP